MESASVDSRAPRVAGLQSGHGPREPAPGSGHKSARLFADLFRKIEPETRLNVLEIGRAQPETVDFFSRFKCRLLFADLYSASGLLLQQAKRPEAELAAGFREALDIPAGEKFDLCLLWDLMQYLTGPAIRALCGALESHIHKGTRAHALGVHSVLTNCERAEYAIAGLNEFKLRKSRLPELEYRPHPQAELAEMLTVFKVERAMLMGDGTVEMLLGAKPYWDFA